MGANGIGKIFGRKKNNTTYNLARMNMLLHGVKDTEFEIYHGDSLTNDWDLLRELNPEEGYNLNISRYISTAVGEAEIVLADDNEKLVAIECGIETATQKHNTFLKELGLPLLP